MTQTHPRRCIIIAPLYDGGFAEVVAKQPGDMIICADGGYQSAVAAGITPDLVVGDFDSMAEPTSFLCPAVRLPREKDDTDMVVCIREGRMRGYRHFDIAGAMGGRADHTLANLQCLADCAMRGEAARMLEERNEITILSPGSYTFRKRNGYFFSLLAYSPEVSGANLAGTAWLLDHATLSNRFPLGISNKIIGDQAALSFESGLLMVIQSKDG